MNSTLVQNIARRFEWKKSESQFSNKMVMNWFLLKTVKIKGKHISQHLGKLVSYMSIKSVTERG